MAVAADYALERWRIADVLARFCECVDRVDLEGLAEIFSEDCVTDYGPGRGGRVVGLASFQERVASVMANFSHTQHLLGHVRAEPRGDAWVATSYVTAWHERGGGDVDVSRLRYVDRLIEVDDGDWRIVERRAEALGLEGGFAGIAYRMLPRELRNDLEPDQ